MKTLFNNFTTAVDSFDFLLKKGASQHYTLEITATSQGRVLEKRVIVLQTNNLELAVKRALKAINTMAREIVPGIKVTGDLTEGSKVTLKPYNEVTPGIRLIEEDCDEEYDEEEYDDCDDCDYYDDCYDEEPVARGFRLIGTTENSRPVESVDSDVLELAQALAKFLRR